VLLSNQILPALAITCCWLFALGWPGAWKQTTAAFGAGLQFQVP